MLADYQQLVDSLVRDQSATLTAQDRDRAIDLARARYSADAERTLVEDIVWGTAGYLGPLPSQWATGAYVLEAESPIGEQPRAIIELATYITPTVVKLAVVEPLGAADVVRLTYAAPHVLTDTVDTVPAEHREALASYAAHVLCKQLATHYSGERETSINADQSNTDSRARNYAMRAKDYRAAYYAGIGKADPQAASSGSSGAGAGASTPAASVGSWAGRKRTLVQTNDQGSWT